VYARTTTVDGRPQAVDAAVGLVRDEVFPAVREMDGCVGLSLLVDRTSGQCLCTTSWEDEPCLRSSEKMVAPWRDRLADVLGGPASTAHWEVAVLHRSTTTTEDACARVTWTQVDPYAVDEQADVFRLVVMPDIKQLPGFVSASLLVNRTTGQGALSTVYRDRTALDESRGAAAALRSESVQRLQADLLGVGEFDVALAHLRVPERY
jgi:quinol monooxygenase YgiN